MNFADVISIDWSIDESDVWLIDRSFDWLIDWSKFVVLMMVDVIEVFGFNFIIVGLEDSDSDSENSKNLKNSENSQSSVDFKKFEKFMTDLFQRIYIYDYVDFFFQLYQYDDNNSYWF